MLKRNLSTLPRIASHINSDSVSTALSGILTFGVFSMSIRHTDNGHRRLVEPTIMEKIETRSLPSHSK